MNRDFRDLLAAFNAQGVEYLVVSMSELEQLEQQILQLSPENLAKFRAWFIELDHQLWDQQIEADVAAGKLDRLIAEARDKFKATPQE